MNDWNEGREISLDRDRRASVVCVFVWTYMYESVVGNRCFEVLKYLSIS